MAEATQPVFRTGIALRCPKCRSLPLTLESTLAHCTCGASFALREGVLDLTGTLAADESVQREKFDALRHASDATADPYHSFVTPGGLRYTRMLRRLKLGPGMTFLEAGCGAGPLCDSLSSNTGAVGFGIDISAGSIAAQLQRRGNRGGYDVAVASATDLPFADGTFDAVLCTDLIEHLANPGGFYTEAARVLKPGGHLLARCNVLDIGLTFDWVQHRLTPKRWQREMAAKGHFYENFKTRAEHRKLVREARLSMVMRRGFDIWWDNIIEYHVLPRLFALRGRAANPQSAGEAQAALPAEGLRLRVPQDTPHRAARALSRLLYVMLWPDHLMGMLGFGASEWMLLRRNEAGATAGEG